MFLLIPFLIPPAYIQPQDISYTVSEAKAIQAFFSTEPGEFPIRPPEKPPEPPPPPPPPPTPPPPPPPVYKPPAPPPAPSGSCHDWLVQAGVTDITNAYDLIMRESGCNPNAVNPYSGACGIGQQLPCGKWPHQWNDPVGSIIDMQGYVFARYGSWANANAFQRANNWY